MKLAPSPSGNRLLLIDDDLDFAESQAEFLQSNGYQVELASGATQALALFRSFVPHIALIDLRLGRSSGLELLEQLVDVAPDVICILMTGHAEVDSAIDALRRGAADYLRKPVAPGDLLQVLDNHMERSRLLAEREQLRSAQRADAAVKAALEEELAARRLIEAELREHQTNLENLVADRTAELQASQERLNQAGKMEALGTLAGGIAHDFNNILTAISGFSELAQRSSEPESATHQHISEIFTAAQRASALVQQILTFTRQTEEKREILHIQDVVQDALTLLRQTLPSSLEIHYTHNSPDSLVHADPTQLHQVLINLCSNAATAVGDRAGNLWISVDELECTGTRQLGTQLLDPGTYLKLTVRDDGRGIDPDIQKRIFEPFFTTSEVGDGTGMGLALVHSIVAAHGGATAVESSPGRGATFIIFIPAAIAWPVANQPEEIALASAGSGKVLVVDDENMIRAFFEAVLTSGGYDLVCCSSGADALAALDADPQAFDLLITDETMPRMTGTSLIAETRKRYPQLPVILCSGNAHIRDDNRRQDLDIESFLVKPVSVDILLQEVDRILSLQA